MTLHQVLSLSAFLTCIFIEIYSFNLNYVALLTQNTRRNYIYRRNVLFASSILNEEKSDKISIQELDINIIPQNVSFPTNSFRRSRGTGIMINKKIMDVFDNTSNNQRDYYNAIQSLISTHNNDFNHVHIVTLLHRSARARFPIHSVVPLSFLVEKLNRPTNRPFRAAEVAQIIYGLRLMSIEDTPDVELLIQAAISRLMECKEGFSGKEIALSLYGLQKFSEESSDIRSLLHHLAEKLRSSNAKLNGQEISNSLYGKFA